MLDSFDLLHQDVWLLQSTRGGFCISCVGKRWRSCFRPRRGITAAPAYRGIRHGGRHIDRGAGVQPWRRAPRPERGRLVCGDDTQV
jgi:hypothetical protein